MTSEERREARYQRRKAARERKKAEKLKSIDNYEEVFSYGNLYRAYRQCRKGVRWKSSTIRYITNAPLHVYDTYCQLMAEKYKTPGFYEFDIFERGKRRHIRSTVISERVVQRCLCDNALIPALERTFIFDNGASMKRKGYSFAINRLTEHLHKHYRKHGQDGYILLFDFSKFFDNVSHKLVKEMIAKELSDERLRRISSHFIDAFGEKGLGLGSQISQVLALASANKLDHVLKEQYCVKYYGRYMDDGYLISHSKEYLRACLRGIKRVCEELEITLNEKKTQIVKLSHGFTWLQCRFYITETGKVIRKMCKNSVAIERRKLKKLKKKFEAGRRQFSDIFDSFVSWGAYASTFNSYYTCKNMVQLFIELFSDEIVKNDKFRLHSKKKSTFVKVYNREVCKCGLFKITA
jgi:retron-type reverse transcriptase